MVIKESVLNPTKSFNLNGLEYEKGVYTIWYKNIELDSSGDIIKDSVQVGLRSKYEFLQHLVYPTTIESWNNGVTSFTDLDSLSSYITSLICFNSGGGVGVLEISQKVETFSELIDGTEIGEISLVETSTGIKFINFKDSGLYIWDGVSWKSDDNSIIESISQNVIDITQEITDRQTADTNLQNQISSNDNMISNLDIDLLQEITARTFADIDLQNDIDNNTINNRIIVKQASDLTGVLDSSKIYIIDGNINMGTNQIEVPSGGLFIQGLDYFVSSIFSSEDNHTIFVNSSGTFAGNVKISRCTLYTSGTNSKIFNLDNQGNFATVELQSVNIGSFSVETTEIGELTAYRQFRVDDCALIRIGDGLAFSGSWIGGFRIGDSITLSIPANTTLFKEGTSLDFIGSSFSDMNAISIDDTVTVFDFQDSNFTRDEGFSLNGARFNVNSNPVPNMTLSSTKRYFKDCSGVENTFAGAEWEITTQTITPLTVGTLVKALGTTTYNNLVHYSQTTDNAPTYDSTIQKDFIITGQLIVDGGANDEIDVVLRQWDNSASGYVDIRTFTRNISNIVGGLDIAYFDPYATVKMDQNDRIEVWVRNNSDDTDITLLNGSFIAINVRN